LQRVERVGRSIVVRTPFLGTPRLFLPLLSPAFLRRFDIVHVHALDQLTDAVSLFRLFGAPPFVVTSHGLFFHTAALARIKRLYFRTMSKATLARAAAVLAVSRADKDKLAEIGIASLLLPNPVAPFPLLYEGGRDLVCWGRIAPNKSIPKLVAFAAELLKLAPGRKLHIVGSGDPAIRADLEQRIGSAGLEQHILCHGYLERPRLERLIRECGFAVSASRYEGYGMAQVEAMTAGLLPVMQPNAAFRELYEASGCGLLVDIDAPAAAARQFRTWELAQRPEDRQRARTFGLSRSWTSVAQAIDAVYASIHSAQAASGRRAPKEGYASC
jgi:alpha-1,3-mannosyltransferase